ncbi:hypothetical protein [Jeotgalibacillus soli]|uniref:Uncharacterized protein n=1 Tax=Jeotgalibacillus soli TaxID=889306 RepID=A0A0C2VS16_9BACL|nr:hypothetical protein [Jeotgalibacillus soli]KIL46783.1 hypothetical protein KP78_19010 [Jeotgalibacillus soli]
METIIFGLGFIVLIISLRKTQQQVKRRLKYGAIMTLTILLYPITSSLASSISIDAASLTLYLHAMLVLTGIVLLLSGIFVWLLQKMDGRKVNKKSKLR